MPISPLNRILLLLCCALLLVSLGLWVTPLEIGRLDTTAISPLQQGPVAIEQSLPRAATDNLDGRPVFDPTRRPPSVAEAPATATGPTSSLSLVGLVIGNGLRIALLRSSDSKDPVRAREGDTVSNWLVKTIGNDHVVVTSDGVTQELRFPNRGDTGAGHSGGGSGVHSY